MNAMKSIILKQIKNKQISQEYSTFKDLFDIDGTEVSIIPPPIYKSSGNLLSRLNIVYQFKLILHCKRGMCSVDRTEVILTCYLVSYVCFRKTFMQMIFVFIFVLPFSASNNFSVIKMKFIILLLLFLSAVFLMFEELHRHKHRSNAI